MLAVTLCRVAAKHSRLSCMSVRAGAGPDSWKVDPSYLTVEQAMADYTVSVERARAGELVMVLECVNTL